MKQIERIIILFNHLRRLSNIKKNQTILDTYEKGLSYLRLSASTVVDGEF